MIEKHLDTTIQVLELFFIIIKILFSNVYNIKLN